MNFLKKLFGGRRTANCCEGRRTEGVCSCDPCTCGPECCKPKAVVKSSGCCGR